MDWYLENVEEPLRGLVKELRDNGFNTEGQSSKFMEIQCQWMIGSTDLSKLDRIIFSYLSNNGFKITYDLTARMRRRNGIPTPYINIHFIKLEGSDISPHKERTFTKD